MSYQDMNPSGTTAQNALVYQGARAVIAAPLLAFASLSNGQTFATITPALAADSRVINAALAASTDRPTFCAALANDLNTAGGGTTAYVWTVNATSDGLVGTAKTPGKLYRRIPTGTALTGGKGSVLTNGAESIAYNAEKLSLFGDPGWLDDFAELAAVYAPGAARIRFKDFANEPDLYFPANTFGTHVAITVPRYRDTENADSDGGGRRPTANASWPLVAGNIIANPRNTPWAFVIDAKFPAPVTGQSWYVGICNLDGSRYIVVQSRYSVQQTQIGVGSGGAFLIGGPTADAAFHKYMVAFNGSDTVTFLCDGAVASIGTTNLDYMPQTISSFTMRGLSNANMCVRSVAYATTG
jgi:hypothetical protein